MSVWVHLRRSYYSCTGSLVVRKARPLVRYQTVKQGLVGKTGLKTMSWGKRTAPAAGSADGPRNHLCQHQQPPGQCRLASAGPGKGWRKKLG